MFLCTHAKVLSCLILVMFGLLVINIYSLIINRSSSITVVKLFNSCIALCNFIIAICISTSSILTTKALVKSCDIEINPEPKKIMRHQVLSLKLKRAG